MFSKKPETDMSNFDQQKPITKTTSKAIGGQPMPQAPVGGTSRSSGGAANLRSKTAGLQRTGPDGAIHHR
jgi:hypothetical protein